MQRVLAAQSDDVVEEPEAVSDAEAVFALQTPAPTEATH
jgi:hypothetical protein